MKIWCNNNLGTIGKWGGASFLFGIMITAFMFSGNIIPSHAYMIDTTTPASFSKPAELNLNFDSVGKIKEVTAPLNSFVNESLRAFRLNQNVNIGTGVPSSPIKNPSTEILGRAKAPSQETSPSQAIDFNKFFSSSKVSSNDITGFLKEAAVTGINLTILVISITSQVLKGLLEAIR